MAKIYLLNSQKFDNVVNLEVFKVQSLKFDIDLKPYDALVFTSKSAIFALEDNKIDWKNIPSYLIAEATSNIAKSFGANIAFTGLIDELVSYETVCNSSLKSFELEEGSTIIFTSPSSVECFFKKFSWNSSFKAILIGKTTAQYLPKELVNYKISSNTNVKECIKLAFQDFS